jgi:hypothetical protein
VGERTMKRDCNIRSRYVLYASPLFCDLRDFAQSKLIVSLSRIESGEKREREREREGRS